MIDRIKCFLRVDDGHGSVMSNVYIRFVGRVLGIVFPMISESLIGLVEKYFSGQQGHFRAI